MKTRRFFLLTTFLILPATALAFLGIGDTSDAVLMSIFSELTIQTQWLKDLFGGITFVNRQVNDMRRGVNDPLSLVLEGVTTGDHVLRGAEQIAHETPFLQPDGSGGADRRWEQGSLRTGLNNVGGLLQAMDIGPLSSLNHASIIADRTELLMHQSEHLFDDLKQVSEGKATVRNAQAQAIQVQQLAQIEENQGMQLSLQSQELLNHNEMYKAVQQVTDTSLHQLEKSLRSSRTGTTESLPTVTQP